jgi:hypothetical protein
VGELARPEKGGDVGSNSTPTGFWETGREQEDGAIVSGGGRFADTEPSPVS